MLLLLLIVEMYGGGSCCLFGRPKTKGDDELKPAAKQEPEPVASQTSEPSIFPNRKLLNIVLNHSWDLGVIFEYIILYNCIIYQTSECQANQLRLIASVISDKAKQKNP